MGKELLITAQVGRVKRTGKDTATLKLRKMTVHNERLSRHIDSWKGETINILFAPTMKERLKALAGDIKNREAPVIIGKN